MGISAFSLQPTRYDAGTTFSIALYGTTEPAWPPCAGPKYHLSWGSLLPPLGLLALPPKINYPMPTDDKAPQPCLSSLLIPAALSQVELYYSMSLSLSLSQHSNYVKCGIKQAKAQKQQQNSVPSYQFFCHWQSQPSVRISQATQCSSHFSAVRIYCVSEIPSFLMV